MKDPISASEQLRRESQELRDVAVDLMEHAALLINKSVELDIQIAKRDRLDTKK
jgi:hypothetical protein